MTETPAGSETPTAAATTTATDGPPTTTGDSGPGMGVLAALLALALFSLRARRRP